MTLHQAEKIKFAANFYHFDQYDGEGMISKICTDNSENLGSEPILVTERECIPMAFDGKYYSAELKYPVKQYQIYYKDTEKFENAGEPVYIDKHKISRDILINDLIACNKPLQKDISKGYTVGKVVFGNSDIPPKEPIVLLLDDVGEGDELTELPSNVKAVIVSDGRIDYLSHIASLSRSYFNLFTILYDEQKYSELKALCGKYVYISNLEGDLKYHTTSKTENENRHCDIKIPRLSEASCFFDYSELTPENSGMKACKIANLKNMAENYILDDINIPNGFVISAGYVNKIEKFLNEVDDQEKRYDRFFENPFLIELDEKCDKAGINPSFAIIRSAFNAEDLYEYPTAGLYESECSYGINDFVLIIDNIYTSKDTPKAVESRKRYGIPDDIIQLSAIVQEYIQSDFIFTAYSDSANKNVIIELGAYEYSKINLEPATVIYDDSTKELSVIKHQVYNSKFITDNNGNIVEKINGHNPVEDNWDMLKPLLIKVAENALTLENIYEKPQDIEGGIRDGKIYFWQTRDIEKNAFEHL